VLFANPLAATAWQLLCKPGKHIRSGDHVLLPEGAVGTFREAAEHGLRVLEIPANVDMAQLFERFGHVPLPPYMERADSPADSADYQTVFAQREGAVAAPTAGLHFTPEILDQLSKQGIPVVRITLHVGIGTFIPVRVDDPRQHQLKPELFQISEHA